MTTSAIDRATYELTESDLQRMMLEMEDLPSEFQGYAVARESALDNEKMAEHGFPGSNAERFREAGRITGYMREFGASADAVSGDGSDFIASTVTHLFDTPESVSTWMHETFLKEFEANVGKEIGNGQELVSVERLEPHGFYDEAVALKALHNDGGRIVAITIVDFRVGRILGVAFVGVLGDHQRLDMATQLATELEKRIVRVALE